MMRRGDYTKESVVSDSRPKRVNPHYKFTNKTVPQIAILGVSLGVMSLVAIFLVILLTFRNGGEAKLSYGLTVVLAFIFSLAGMIFSVKARMMPDTYLFFSTFGIGINGVNIFLIIYILGRGIMNY